MSKSSQKILVPVSFGAKSSRALERAMGMLESPRDVIIVAHSIHPAPGAESDALKEESHEEVAHQREFDDLCRKRLDEFLKGELSEEQLSRVTPIALKGDPGEEIVRAIREEEVDLVIMGASRAGFGENSVTEKVTSEAGVPVVVVGD